MEKNQQPSSSIIDLWIDANRRVNSKFMLTRPQYNFALGELQHLRNSLPKEFTDAEIEQVMWYAVREKKWASKIQSARQFVDLWNAITYEMENGAYNPTETWLDPKSIREKAEREAVERKWDAAKEATRRYGDMGHQSVRREMSEYIEPTEGGDNQDE